MIENHYMYAPKVMLKFLYKDMEQLAVPHDLLWFVYAKAKTFRIV